MPKVSVIIPAYNAMAYLPGTVDSLQKQTFVDFEAIIVNDGSSDNIETWVAQLTDPRIQCITQHNQGPSAARNTGIDHAQGEYIAFLDADDLWDASKLEKQVQVLDSNSEVGLVYTWAALMDQHGNPTGRIVKSEAQGKVWQQLIEHNFVSCGSTPLIRRACFDRVGKFDLDLRGPEDRDMWLRIASQYPFAVVKEPLVYYRVLDSSVSKNLPVMERSSLASLDKAFASPPPDVTTAELENLKSRTYGSKYLLLAWYAIKSHSRDYAMATQYAKKAVEYYPRVKFSSSYVRLMLTIMTIRWFGTASYNRLLSLVYLLRRSIVGTVPK
jgi:glycosyltransferase involved in cell wall biosynthesis